MKTYRFVTTVVVRGKTYHDGDQVGEAEFPPGCVSSCLRSGYMVEHLEPSTEGLDWEEAMRQRAREEEVAGELAPQTVPSPEKTSRREKKARRKKQKAARQQPAQPETTPEGPPLPLPDLALIDPEEPA